MWNSSNAEEWMPPSNASVSASTVPNSPTVNAVTNESGFIPLRYALRYGTYIVPHIRLAPNAAAIPRNECCPIEPPWIVLKPNITAAITIAIAPTTTLPTFFPLAPSNSRNSTRPQKSPISAFAFHMGNATASPTSRIAKTVSVFATAHNAPARRAHTIKCFFCMRSANTYPVPFSSVGKVQRAVKTPATIHNEIANGENPEFTSFVGASAAPSHTPAVKPQITPKPCSDNLVFSARCTVLAMHLSLLFLL